MKNNMKKENKRYLDCKYLDAGMDGMLCSKNLCTTCIEFNGKKCSEYISKNRKKITKTTNWLTKGMTQEEIKKIKEEALEEADKELAQIEEREKQIEETAIELATTVRNILENKTVIQYIPDLAVLVAKELIKHCHPKLTNDEMIISKVEYDALKQIESFHIASCGKGSIVVSAEELTSMFKDREQTYLDLCKRYNLTPSEDVCCANNNNENILKEALEYFTGMHGFTLERNVYGGKIEYSCNGYVVDEYTFKVLYQAKELTNWWE